MAILLQFVAAAYLIAVWFVFYQTVTTPGMFGVAANSQAHAMAFVISVLLSIPAAVLFVFGRIAADVRRTADHLEAIRSYLRQQSR